MIDLNAMAAFVRVVDLEGFSAAARSLKMTPSAVSKQISRLEDHLDVRLLHRTTRKLSLTEAGAAFYERATRVLADAKEAERAVADLSSIPRGRLRISMPQLFGRVQLIPILVAFASRYPEVRLDLRYEDSLVDLVADGIDVAVRIGVLDDSSLIVRRLASNRRAICGTPAYFAEHGRPQVPGDLAEHNCLVFRQRVARHHWPFRGPDGREELVAVGGSAESNEVEALLAFVRAGQGVAMLPLWMVGRDLAEGRLEEALADYHVPDNAIHVVYPSNRHLSPNVRAFVDFLVESFRDWPS